MRIIDFIAPGTHNIECQDESEGAVIFIVKNLYSTDISINLHYSVILHP